MSLLEGDPAAVRTVAVVTRSKNFKKLFASILSDWKYQIVDDLDAARLIFAERGLALPSGVGDVVRLTPMPQVEGAFLTTPISLTGLYNLLEDHFFAAPRHHIRVSMDVAINLSLGEASLPGRLLTISGRGARIACGREMPRGSLLRLEIPLDGKVWTLPAEVMYTIPAADVTRDSQPQVGVLFKPADDRQYQLLRGFIEKTCLEVACARAGIALNDPCLSWLDVPIGPWGAAG